MSKGFDNVPKVLKLDKPKKNKIQFLQVIRLIHLIRFNNRLFKILIIFLGVTICTTLL
jgi:hypothetical protein